MRQATSSCSAIGLQNADPLQINRTHESQGPIRGRSAPPPGADCLGLCISYRLRRYAFFCFEAPTISPERTEPMAPAFCVAGICQKPAHSVHFAALCEATPGPLCFAAHRLSCGVVGERACVDGECLLSQSPLSAPVDELSTQANQPLLDCPCPVQNLAESVL
jgi:hypothetical protein